MTFYARTRHDLVHVDRNLKGLLRKLKELEVELSPTPKKDWTKEFKETVLTTLNNHGLKNKVTEAQKIEGMMYMYTIVALLPSSCDGAMLLLFIHNVVVVISSQPMKSLYETSP
jgi:hypothetical protein